ncbi:MAG: DTW domain-containing protein [Cellvibrionaceae bacterium]|nr:DTW domain-containing protein [Cellvibrionaceae bacterium]
MTRPCADCLPDASDTMLSPLRIHLVYHPRELLKRSNTGQLLQSALGNCVAQTWQRGQAIFAKQDNTPKILIYPERLARRYRGIEGKAHPQLTLPGEAELVLLDASWQDAQKIYNRSPELQQLPLLSLAAGQLSDMDCGPAFRLRRNQKPAGLATVQTAIALHLLAGHSAIAEALRRRYCAFLRCSESGH